MIYYICNWILAGSSEKEPTYKSAGEHRGGIPRPKECANGGNEPVLS